ncbi:MAG: hypothetical protein HY769_07505 [Candidatus Stahlbacteria bacterium]|nr:hypothetical protein [Candidatus Stahlbacteria bacterium]
MRFNFADVVRAARVGFSAKKIWVGFIGLLFGTILYSVMAYVAYACSPDWTWYEVWGQFKYIPVPVIGQTHFMWYGWVAWAVGIAFFVMMQLLSIGAISKLTIEQLRGDEFYEVTDALKHSFKQWKSVILSPGVLVVFIASLILVGFICGLIGRIPHAGQVLAGLFFIPVAFGAIFIVYLTIVFVLSLVLSPTIGTTTDSDTFDTLFELFSCLNDQTWRIVVWEAFVGVSSFAGVWIFGWLIKKSLILFQWAVGIWAGTRMIDGTAHSWWSTIWNNGLWYLSPCPPIQWVENIIGRMVPILIYPKVLMPVNVAEWIGGFLIGISFYFVAFLVMAYGISIWAAGQTLIYTVLVKIKDEKNLLEKKEEVFEEEEVEEKKEEKTEEKTEESACCQSKEKKEKEKK